MEPASNRPELKAATGASSMECETARCHVSSMPIGFQTHTRLWRAEGGESAVLPM